MFRRRTRAGGDVIAVSDDPVGLLVGERLEAVGAELASITGNASLCSLSRSGGRVDGAKYLEGRMAALMELRRRYATTDDIMIALDAVSAEWRRQLDRSRFDGFGPEWIAYRAGGVDELEELLDRLGPTAG